MISTVAIEAIRPELSEFGKYVYALMTSKGVQNFSQLCVRFEVAGDRIHRQTLMGYVKGDAKTPAEFGRRLANALDLTEEESRELAWQQFLYG